MRIGHITRQLSVAVFAFCITVTGLVGNAQSNANFEICISCADHNIGGGAPSWHATTGTIYLWVKINGEWLDYETISGDNCLYEAESCLPFWDLYDDGYEWDDVEKIAIYNNSNDCVWLDRVKLREHGFADPDGVTWGNIDMYGYCVDKNANLTSSHCISDDSKTWWYLIP